MTRLATTPAILGILVSGMVATGLLAGCGSNKVPIGQQNVDAAAGSGGAAGRGSDAAAAGSGGSATGGVTAGGGITATGGSPPTGGSTVSGGAAGAGGATPAGGTTGTSSGGNGGAGGSSKVTSSGGTSGSGGVKASGGATATGGSATGTGCAPGWTLCCGQCLSPMAGVCMTPCPPTGGGGSIGGTPSTGGTTGAGGATRTGGATGTGGTTRSGGNAGTGGATGTGGTGGSTGKTCGGIAGVTCATGQFCDLLAGSCNVSDATGTCVVNVGVGCITIYQPVCGCDGKTYPSDCDRRAAGVSKKADGACPTTDASAGSCSQVTTQAACDSRSDCHSVFLPGTACACAPAGCCQLFNRCADGGRANCTGPVACLAPQPVCAPPYALSYTNVCFEGCVLQSECAGADAGSSIDASSPAALCTATGGQVSSALCCNSVTDFPNSCLIGACGCAPSSSHTVSTCTCAAGCFMPAYGCVGPAGTCTVGADQTCNDTPSISSLHGHCVDDGRCLCGSGLLLASGKCQ